MWFLKYWMNRRTETDYDVPEHILECFRTEQIVPSAISLNDYRSVKIKLDLRYEFSGHF